VIVDEEETHYTGITGQKKEPCAPVIWAMVKVGLGTRDISIAPRRGADVSSLGWAAPGIGLAGAAAGTFTSDVCSGPMAVPAGGLAFTVLAVVLWVASVPRARRDLITLSVLGALALMFMADLQRLLVCMLGRAGMVTVDLLSACGAIVLAFAIAAEIDRRRRARAAAAAIAAERRRLARELHDGVAQELAYIRAQSRRMEGGASLVEAADRALDESRAAIAALTRAVDEPLTETIRGCAQSVGERYGLSVICDLAPDVEADDATREALLRIVREAIGNAARHGAATKVHVELRAGPSLSVSDDGCGFDLSRAVRPDALGLTSMRERTEALGGRFALTSRPDAGTRVDVALS